MNEVINNFNEIAMLPDKWDHNKHYEKYILKLVQQGARVLDVGCGTGELAYSLSQKAKYIDAIDLSPAMIEQAKKRHSAQNINYQVCDFYDLDESNKYDCIISVAAFHHLNLDTALHKIKRMLKEGGLLIVLDLYERRGLIDFMLDCAAMPANIILKLIKNKSLKDTPIEKKLWIEHSKYDNYKTFKELKKVYKEKLSISTKIKKFMFWRYFLVYKNK